jgi:hypothetical protein
MWACVGCCLSDVLLPWNISPCADNAAMTEFVMSAIAAFICELDSSDVELAFMSIVLQVSSGTLQSTTCKTQNIL